MWRKQIVLQESAEQAVPSAEDRHRMLVEWNQTNNGFPECKCIHEFFEERAAEAPGSTAVIDAGGSLTYAELNARANQLAWRLRELGVGPERKVGICLERSLEMVVGLLAVLKAGGAYVPLDPGYPPTRLAHMLTDSMPMAVLSHSAAHPVLYAAMGGPGSDLTVLDLKADVSSWAGNARENLNNAQQGLASRNVAYVIYTSGSTGVPKGVMNEHRGLVNRLCWMQSRYPLDRSDAVLQKTPFSFDVSVWEFLWTLMTGARMVMARPEGHRDPAYLRRIIQEEGVTTLHFVPSMLNVFLADRKVEQCTSLKRVFCSGEALSTAVLKRFSEKLPCAALHNLYGPTEAAIDVTYWDWNRGAALPEANPPIGRPIWNTQIYILDACGNPAPPGTDGDIHIGGVGVARGYLNRPDLTAERFVADPFATGQRLYRTGDRGRFLPDGNVEYLGRDDHQIKLNGYRIELGEIESRLLQHPDVSEAAVLVREDRPGDRRLIAYFTTVEGRDLSVENLRSTLSKALAKHMLPSAFVRLPQFPLSLNGKLDRKALPAPDARSFDLRRSLP